MKPRSFHSLALVAFCLFSADLKPVRGDVALTRLEDKIRVEIDGRLFTEYLPGARHAPVLYPIVGPHGIGMTRN